MKHASLLGAAALAMAIVAVLLVLAFSTGEESISLGGGAIALISLTGPLEDPRTFQRQIEEIEGDRRVRALVVRIDSPGGGVATSQEIHAALRRYKITTGNPVVASFGEVAASGGYYVACAADRIVANPGSVTGSIGVILSFADAEGLLERIGLRFQVLKSGPMKDQGAFWRDLTEEERERLQETVDDVFEQFLLAVEAGRGLAREDLLQIADGRIFSGHQALAVGLVDTLGDLSVALDEARRLGRLGERATVRRMSEREGWLEWLRRGGVLPGSLDPGLRLEYRLDYPRPAAALPGR